MLVTIVTSLLTILTVAMVAFALGYNQGTQHVRQEAVDRKLASWKRKTVGYGIGPIIVEKFTWVGEEQDEE